MVSLLCFVAAYIYQDLKDLGSNKEEDFVFN